MRLIDGSTFPLIILSGWIFALISISLIYKRRSNLSNQELSNLAAFGAFIFLIQSLTIFPVTVAAVPIIFSLNGTILVITIKGPTKGIIIVSSGMILNHLFIPGSLSMLGINLSNMIILGLLIGWFPHKIFTNPALGRRIRYTATLLSGLIYVIAETLLISLEVVIFYQTETNFLNFFYGFVAIGTILGLLEGLFTAISSSYYHRTFISKPSLPQIQYLDESSPEIEKIQFDIADTLFPKRKRPGRKPKIALSNIDKIDFNPSFTEDKPDFENEHTVPDLN